MNLTKSLQDAIIINEMRQWLLDHIYNYTFPTLQSSKEQIMSFLHDLRSSSRDNIADVILCILENPDILYQEKTWQLIEKEDYAFVQHYNFTPQEFLQIGFDYLKTRAITPDNCIPLTCLVMSNFRL